MARLDLVTIEDLGQFREDLLKDIAQLLKGKAGQDGTQQWMRSAHVRKMLNISPGTLQNLRVNGMLRYTKVGGTMFYKTSDIEKMLKDGAV